MIWLIIAIQKNNFLISSIRYDRVIYFENIIEIELRVFKKLNIDDHWEVRKIVKMIFTENFKLFDKEYFKGKKNILINMKVMNFY